MTCGSQYASNPTRASSRPNPDCFTPPKGAFREQLLDVPVLLVVVYRPHRDRRVEAVPHNVGIEASDERVHEIVGETLRRVDPLYAEAELTRCGEGAPNEVADQILVQRDVVQQDGCVVATKLERQVLD